MFDRDTSDNSNKRLEACCTLNHTLLPFRFGLGRKIGSGRKHWSWISLPDLVRSILFAVEEDSLTGPATTVAPDAVIKAGFTRAGPRAAVTDDLSASWIYGSAGSERNGGRSSSRQHSR